MGCGQTKNIQLEWQYHQLLSGFLAKGYFPRVSRQSRRSLMLRVIMKWSLGAVYRSPGICLTAEENPQKTLAKRPSDEGAVRPVIASNGVPFLQMWSVGLHRRKELSKGCLGSAISPMKNEISSENTFNLKSGRPKIEWEDYIGQIMRRKVKSPH